MFSLVTFAEIEASNRKNSGQLPLLPPVAGKKKGREGREGTEEPLSKTAIKNAVKKFLNDHKPFLTREEYERDQKQTERLAKEGKLFRFESGGSVQYQEWQNANQMAIDDCLRNNRVSLQDLCTLRWERFEQQSETRKRAALKRTQAKGKPNRGRRKKRRDSPA